MSSKATSAVGSTTSSTHATWSKGGHRVPNIPEAIIQPANSFHWEAKGEIKDIMKSEVAPMEVDANPPASTAGLTSSPKAQKDQPPDTLGDEAEQAKQAAATRRCSRMLSPTTRLSGPAKRHRRLAAGAGDGNVGGPAAPAAQVRVRSRALRATTPPRPPRRMRGEGELARQPGLRMVPLRLRLSCHRGECGSHAR